jgi:hypothetical protein
MTKHTPPFVELIERFDASGVASAVVVCKQLPAGHSCRIRREGEYYVRRTKANGKGSIRYTVHLTVEDAFREGRQWVLRKVAEARREAAKS